MKVRIFKKTSFTKDLYSVVSVEAKISGIPEKLIDNDARKRLNKAFIRTTARGNIVPRLSFNDNNTVITFTTTKKAKCNTASGDKFSDRFGRDLAENRAELAARSTARSIILAISDIARTRTNHMVRYTRYIESKMKKNEAAIKKLHPAAAFEKFKEVAAPAVAQ